MNFIETYAPYLPYIAGAVLAVAIVREYVRGQRLRRAQDKARNLLVQPLTDEQVRRITRKVMAGIDEWERKEKRRRQGRIRWIVKRDVA